VDGQVVYILGFLYDDFSSTGFGIISVHATEEGAVAAYDRGAVKTDQWGNPMSLFRVGESYGHAYSGYAIQAHTVEP
jgi:hypothetical protein